jgi:indole-3-glycerol phosphate synthase
VLGELYAGSLADAERRRELISIDVLEKNALSNSPALDALKFLAPSANVKILAEVKRASPSRGQLADIPDPAALAKIYSDNGASAISVLTEERKFKGSLEDLESVRAVVDVPLLRKDFIANEYQILEARAAGADIVLLIVAGLKSSEISRLMEFTIQLGMTPFIETHSEDELKLAVDLGAALIGVNARDLSTFETDRNLFGDLVGIIPTGVIKVAESAVRNSDDIRHYREAGADVVLVGEALVTGDPVLMLRSFLESGKS